MKYKLIISICLLTVVIIYMIAVILSDNKKKSPAIYPLAELIYTKPDKSEYLILSWTIKSVNTLYWFKTEQGYNLFSY